MSQTLQNIRKVFDLEDTGIMSRDKFKELFLVFFTSGIDNWPCDSFNRVCSPSQWLD